MVSNKVMLFGILFSILALALFIGAIFSVMKGSIYVGFFVLVASILIGLSAYNLLF